MELSNLSYNIIIYKYLQSYNQSDPFKNEPNVELETSLVWDTPSEEYKTEADGTISTDYQNQKENKYPITVTFYNIETTNCSLKPNKEDSFIFVLGNAKANHRINVSSNERTLVKAGRLETQAMRFITWLDSIPEIVADKTLSITSYKIDDSNAIILIETFFQYRYGVFVSYIKNIPRIRRGVINDKEIYTFPT